MDANELLDAHELSLVLSEAKSVVSELPPGNQRTNLETRIREIENKLEAATARVWRSLGFQLHDCKNPPALILWNESIGAHVCENCGHTKKRAHATNVKTRYNPFSRSRR